MSKTSRTKGKTFEQWVARKLRAIYGDGVKRGWQARRGDDAPDVYAGPWAIECKHRRVLAIPQAMQQAIANASGLTPLVVSRPHGAREEQILVTLLWPDFLRLIGGE